MTNEIMWIWRSGAERFPRLDSLFFSTSSLFMCGLEISTTYICYRIFLIFLIHEQNSYYSDDGFLCRLEVKELSYKSSLEVLLLKDILVA